MREGWRESSISVRGRRYTLSGFKPSASTKTYASRVNQVAGSQLDMSAESFASGGFVIPAATTNSAGYTLWGFKEAP